MSKRTYSPEFRARAVADVEAAAARAASTWEAVRVVADQLDVPARTLVTWVRGTSEPRRPRSRRRPPGRPVGADGAVTRERVLQVAQQTIAELGTSASVREIAERCGLSGNALYHYFPTKADLVAAVTERNYEEFFGHLEAAASSGDSLTDDLRRMVDALEEFLEARPWFPFVLARTLPGVFRRRAPLPIAARRLVDAILVRATARDELVGEDREHIEGLVAVILMGLTMNGPSVRDSAFSGVRWMLSRFTTQSAAETGGLAGGSARRRSSRLVER